jgi:hypothetical protein
LFPNLQSEQDKRRLEAADWNTVACDIIQQNDIKQTPLKIKFS